MKFLKYVKSNLFAYILFSIFYSTIILLLIAFKCPWELIIAVSVLLFAFVSVATLGDYFRKRKFYTSLLDNIRALDQAYLVLETLETPTFYEGAMLYEALYEIDKSMCENINILKEQVTDFKDYIEMWIHEVKIPLASLALMRHNHKEKYDEESIRDMKRIEDYVEQVLYYVRAENAEKDYLIKKVSLEKVMTNVALKYKDVLLEEKIEFKVEGCDIFVLTDAKWLEFILSQIMANAVKYRVLKRDSYIEIKGEDDEDRFVLTITDNGIGIPSSDLPRVFDKSFTGKNGRVREKSTGMGLFIAKNLVSKLGHKIEIDSVEGEYTKVSITFFKNEYYDVF